ncbi:MAG: hypothetical protein FT714_12175 [Pantoea sp. Pent]|nr:hypothetical protein [Pantoea sp. Pent]
MKIFPLRRGCIIFVAKAFFMSTFSGQANAGLDYACWSDPLQTVILTSARLVGIGQPNKGFEGTLSFERTPGNFTAKCNNSDQYERSGIFVEGELGDYFVPSLLNGGYSRLTDENDVKVQAYVGENWTSYPLKLADRKSVYPGHSWLQPGQEVIYNNFLTRNYARMIFVVTKDIIGGAIFIPPNIEITTIYAIVSRRKEEPLPPKPDKPLLRIVIGPHGIIIPVPIVCDINNGTDINVEFDRIAVSSVSESVSNAANYKDVPLEVKCSSALNQEVNLRLVAGTTSFSDELIATNYPDLGIAVKHKGQLLKPMGTSAVRLINGMASEVITVFPVKKKGQPLSGGEFNASATLLISLP